MSEMDKSLRQAQDKYKHEDRECKICGTVRSVRIINGRPVSEICRKCAIKKRSNFSYRRLE